MFGWGKKKSEANLQGGSNGPAPTPGHGQPQQQKFTKCFGVPFMILQRDENDIPVLVRRCIEYLEQEAALRQEGICSNTPSVAEVQRVQHLFEEAVDHNQVRLHGCDFGAVAGVLKRFFRELPAPIYTNELYPNFVAIQSLSSTEELLQEIANLFVNLPTANQMILHLLLRWLHKLVQYSSVNGLTATRLATLWQPNLIFDSSPGAVMSDSLHMTADGQMVGLIVTMMIEYYPHFFAEFDAHFAAADAERAAQRQREEAEAQAQAQLQQSQTQTQQQPQQFQQHQQSQYMNYFEQAQQQQAYAQESEGSPQTDSYQQQQQQVQQQPSQSQGQATQAAGGATPNRATLQQAQRLQFGAIANEALLKRGPAADTQQPQQQQQPQPPVSPRNAPVVPMLPTGNIPQISGASGAVSPRLPTNAPVVQYGQPQPVPPGGTPKLNVVIPPSNVQVAAPGATKQNLGVPQTPSSATSPRSPSSQPGQQQPLQSQRKVPVVVNGYTKGLALADWSEPFEGRLPLAKDDVIFITYKHADGWWEGYKFGRRGFFPSTYVSEICQ